MKPGRKATFLCFSSQCCTGLRMLGCALTRHRPIVRLSTFCRTLNSKSLGVESDGPSHLTSPAECSSTLGRIRHVSTRLTSRWSCCGWFKYFVRCFNRQVLCPDLDNEEEGMWMADELESCAFAKLGEMKVVSHSRVTSLEAYMPPSYYVSRHAC